MRFLRLFIMGFLLIIVQPVRAAGVVTDCSAYGPGAGTLQAALSGGGTITFACSGTIIVPGIDISMDTSIDGSGHNVILSGNNANYVMDIYSGANVTISNLTIADGYSDASGGSGLSNSDGAVIIDHVTLTNNNSAGSGGAIANGAGSFTIQNSTITHNQSAKWGGGVHNLYGILVITDSTISNNSAEAGGGVFNNQGTLTITDSTISDNTLQGDPYSQYGGGIVTYYAPSVIMGSIISGNSGGELANGGGISGHNLTIRDSVISNNVVGNANGGIAAVGLTLINSRVINNEASSYAGISVRGYLDNRYSIIESSLIAGNIAEHQVGGISAIGNVRITNSTITDNQAGESGGGMALESGVEVVNSTIVGNSAPIAAGIDVYKQDTIYNTLIASNTTGENCRLYDDNASLVTATSLSDDDSCPDFTQTTLAKLNLDALMGDYFPLLRGSVAIDAGSADFCPEIDQRGVARPQGNGCDVGAYEYE